MKFSALNVDFSNSSQDPLDSNSLHMRVSKRGTHLESGYLSVVGLSSLKMVADSTDMLLNAGDEFLWNVNIDDLE